VGTSSPNTVQALRISLLLATSMSLALFISAGLPWSAILVAEFEIFGGVFIVAAVGGVARRIGARIGRSPDKR
jgi:hypothetical protein